MVTANPSPADVAQNRRLEIERSKRLALRPLVERLLVIEDRLDGGPAFRTWARNYLVAYQIPDAERERFGRALDEASSDLRNDAHLPLSARNRNTARRAMLNAAQCQCGKALCLELAASSLANVEKALPVAPPVPATPSPSSSPRDKLPPGPLGDALLELHNAWQENRAVNAEGRAIADRAREVAMAPVVSASDTLAVFRRSVEIMERSEASKKRLVAAGVAVDDALVNLIGSV